MWMPTFPEITGDSRRMNSNHAVATVADAAAKGLQFDLAKAYELAVKELKKKHWLRGRVLLPVGLMISIRRMDISLHFRKEKKKQTRMYIISKSVSRLQLHWELHTINGACRA